MSDWLIGRQEIADYSRVSVWTVTAMLKAGLNCYSGTGRGSQPRTTKQDVNNFFKDNPDFIASDYHKPKPRIRNV